MLGIHPTIQKHAQKHTMVKKIRARELCSRSQDRGLCPRARPARSSPLKHALHKQPFGELAIDLQKHVRTNMFASAMRVLSEMLHRGPEERQQTLNRMVVCALEEIGFKNFGLCLVVMKCLMGLTKQRVTAPLLCGLIKLMCASPKTHKVSFLCEAYTTEWGRQHLEASNSVTRDFLSEDIPKLLAAKNPQVLTLLYQLPLKTKADVRAAFSHFDPYLSPDTANVVAMFERAFWKRRRAPEKRLFLCTLPINIMEDVPGISEGKGCPKALILPAVEPCFEGLAQETCHIVNCNICCKLQAKNCK